MNVLTVRNTVYFSIVVQIISTVITWGGFFKSLRESDKVLKEILAIENIVQIIEFTFYFVIATYNTEKWLPIVILIGSLPLPRCCLQL